LTDKYSSGKIFTEVIYFMSKNPLKELIDNHLGLAPYRVADEAGLTRGAVYRLYRPDDLPNAETDTLKAIAEVLGHRLVISFEPIAPQIHSTTGYESIEGDNGTS
jgi:hypothetical protein